MKNNNGKYIGIFDSGIGGLTVVKEVKKLLPHENIVYLGDTARVPYGIKSERTIIKYAESNVNFLLSKGIKILIVACNTASAHAVKRLKQKLDIPVIGVIEPGASRAAAVTRNKKIGIIGTPSTINSGAYTKVLMKINPDLEITAKPCPLFVPLAEEGWHNNEIAILAAQKYLYEFKQIGVDTLILGCTHYPLLKQTIENVMGSDVYLVDSAEESAIKAKYTIEKLDLARTNKERNENRYFLTDTAETFISVASKFLGDDLSNIEVVDIT